MYFKSKGKLVFSNARNRIVKHNMDFVWLYQKNSDKLSIIAFVRKFIAPELGEKDQNNN
jgi:hypothetical protein